MAVRIRLSRHGKKGYAFYHINVADSRAPRDGRFIERIGSYNPNTNPATIELNFDRAIYWLGVGAQPSETCRRILSYKGALLKMHLAGGVAKGALTQEQADAKFNAWVAGKENQVATKKQKLASDKDAAQKQAIASETAVSQKRAEEIAKKKLAELEAAAAAKEEEVVEVSEEAPVAEEATETPTEA